MPALLPALAWAAGGNPAARVELPSVEVVSTTPLPGLGVPAAQVPANVQRATAKDMDDRRAVDLPDYLERSLDSVSANAVQNNPYQPDLLFRGYSASPLLGTPQGLSVFVDGVRVNEAFGDVVNWDLIPRNAISSVTLVPGSNPVFGLNTLGGALALQTKSGFQHPGYGLRATAGSFGRRSAEAEYGGHGERVDYFVAATRLSESGWRQHSESELRQFFAKTGYQDERTDIDLSATLADNTLSGTQALPVSMRQTPRAAYTWPDRTANELAFFNLRASRYASDDALWSGNAYYRRRLTDGYFSNVNDDYDPRAAGSSPGYNNATALDQRGYGATLQLTLSGKLLGRAHQLDLGASADVGDSGFVNLQQPATFTADRGTLGAGAFSAVTDVAARNRYYGLYAADTWSFAERWHLALSGRYNRARIAIADRSGTTPALDGSHAYNRFNPAAGVTYTTGAATLYAGYNRGMRTPTPAELTCADPGAPCRLPNAFLADPPLRPVLATTWETGLRGRQGAWRWRAAVYRSALADDIQFVNTERVPNAGYFQNVGSTRRQGLELDGAYRGARFSLYASYAWMDATYRTGFTLPSANNSAAVDTDGNGTPDSIRVRAGNRIPGIPRQMLKVRVEARGSDRLTLGLNAIAAGGQYARGDDNNADAGGALAGYAVFHADARYALDKGWTLLGRVTNLFDRRYDTFGVLGTNFFRGPGGSYAPALAVAEQFRAQAAPRGMWIGVAYRFGER